MSKVITVSYEGISFNATWAATKTEKEFVDHESHHGLTPVQLKEAHKLCKAAVKAPVETADPAPTETT
jgi:hypothetical protein